MNKYHPKYRIKQGDTLQSITQLFGVEQDVWMRYHNNMCRLENVIRDRLPKNLEEIYLLPELWEREVLFNQTIPSDEVNHKIRSREQNENYEHKLLTNWVIYPKLNRLNSAYWFRYIIEDKKFKTEIRYKILVRFLQQESEDSMLYLINRISNVYLNDELPNLCMDELAHETGQVFYPMVIEVDKKMQWIALRNYEQIKRNWFNTVRPHVELRFGGDIGLQYLTKMDEVIDNKNKVEEIFKNNIFFKLYFNTFYHSYSQQFEIDRLLEFSIEKGFPFYYKVKCKLNKNLTNKGYKEIIQKGESLIRASGKQDDFMEDGQASYSARILLETKTNYVQEVVVEWSLQDTQRKIKLILYPLREQCEDKFDVKIDKISNNNGLFPKLFG